MSRSGYTYECDDYWADIRWRGAVKAALRGHRGQAFLREMLAAFDAMPAKRLISSALEEAGEVCAIGAVGRTRGLDMAEIDPEDREQVAACFGIAEAMAAEIAYVNDEDGNYSETPEQRFERVRRWVVSELKSEDGGGPDAD